jgi:hypothetical protein
LPEDFANELRTMNITPHVAAKAKGSAIDGRTTRHAGHAISQRIRKRIEEAFGWSKTVGAVANTILRGVKRSAPSLCSRSPPTTSSGRRSCSRLNKAGSRWTDYQPDGASNIPGEEHGPAHSTFPTTC